MLQILVFLVSQPKTYVVGTQKICLNETVLLSTKYKCLKLMDKKNSQFYAPEFCFSYFSAKTYVVGPQKDYLNRDNEMVLLSTHNEC